MLSVTKLCADHLRACSNIYGVKLKSGHAHELVAAFFGYKSRAAMLADPLTPERNLSKVEFLVQMPLTFIAGRQMRLEGLNTALSEIYMLGKELFVKLLSEKMLSCRIFDSWAHLSEVLTTEYLQKQGDLILPLNFRMQYEVPSFFAKPLYEFNPEIEITNSFVKLIVANSYATESNTRFRGSIDIKVAIKLQRIAGFVGYESAEISCIGGSSQSFSQTGVAI